MDPEIKVTRINDRWHARLILDGKVRDEMACEYQQDISRICQIMLRWHDKLGGNSKMAYASRHRYGLKPQRARGALGKIWYIGTANMKVII